MGQGKEVKTRPDPKVEIQVKGEIFFFYRPKVDKDEAHGPDDVQRMYIVLRPESAEDRAVEEKQAPDSGKEGRKHHRQGDGDGGGAGKEGGHHEGGHGKEEVNVEERPLLRLVVMGKKSLPDPAKHGRPYWGYVELVTTKLQDIKDALKEEEYSTATRGQRRRPAARALGEGVYRILKHESGRAPHTHLVYKLELPTRGDGEPLLVTGQQRGKQDGGEQRGKQDGGEGKQAGGEEDDQGTQEFLVLQNGAAISGIVLLLIESQNRVMQATTRTATTRTVAQSTLVHPQAPQ